MGDDSGGVLPQPLEHPSWMPRYFRELFEPIYFHYGDKVSPVLALCREGDYEGEPTVFCYFFEAYRKLVTLDDNNKSSVLWASVNLPFPLPRGFKGKYAENMGKLVGNMHHMESDGFMYRGVGNNYYTDFVEFSDLCFLHGEGDGDFEGLDFDELKRKSPVSYAQQKKIVMPGGAERRGSGLIIP